MSAYLELTVHEKLAVTAALGPLLGTQKCPCASCANEGWAEIRDENGVPIHLQSAAEWFATMSEKAMPLFTPVENPTVPGELRLTWIARAGA
jgi:hypothetical protein